MAHAAQAVRPIAAKIAARMKRFFDEQVEEIGAGGFRVKVRAGLNEGNWQRHGEQLLRDCADQDKPVLFLDSR